jgi:hypothetical protein
MLKQKYTKFSAYQIIKNSRRSRRLKKILNSLFISTNISVIWIFWPKGSKQLLNLTSHILDSDDHS